ncbi:MAG: hypothetical protein KJ818_07190, partial [Candidatus Omnitrophica bacterium]|nr:hypothetical protein [Candidatus Omnitrophota bacterium]
MNIRELAKREVNFHSVGVAYLILGSILSIAAGFCIMSGYSMIHDAIDFHGAQHFYYTNLSKGLFPLWNPYSQTGTPFYVYFQAFGLLEPINFVVVFLQSITGCTTFTSYLVLYFTYYFIFIAGVYNLLRVVTKDNAVSLLFSLIMLVTCFANFMRQSGTLTYHFLTPFIIFFTILFFSGKDKGRMGLYLFITGTLLAINLNIFIPVGIILYFGIFVIAYLIFIPACAKESIYFLKSKKGCLWLCLTAIVVLLISSPVLVFYFELMKRNEIFPTVRFLQKNLGNLVKFFATDVGNNLFDPSFTNNHKTGITVGNLLGILFEPVRAVFKKIQFSEVKLYLGIFPLICVVIGLAKARNGLVKIFSVACAFIFLLMFNFGTKIESNPTFIQNIFGFIMPFYKKFEVLQNLGTLFLLSILVIGAVGFKCIFASPSAKYLKNITVIVISILILKLFFLEGYSYLAIICLILLFKVHRYRGADAVKKFKFLLLIIIFFDLFIYVYSYRNVFKDYYYVNLKREKMLRSKQEEPFINYRVPFSLPDTRTKFNSFFGHELYKTEKAAFPATLKADIDNQFRSFPEQALWDHLYMTSYYYDYLVNIRLGKQLATSSVIYPIINFYPLNNVVWGKDKYEVAKSINNTSLKELGKVIYIEKEMSTRLCFIGKDFLFNP